MTSWAIKTDRLFAKKSVFKIRNEENNTGYRRSLNVFDLTSLGIGGIIGAGIFVLTGKAAHDNAGPAISVAFVIAGFVSALASLCYAELGSTLPVSGSAYTFTYATLGELMAWIIGWDLMLEYLVGAATVAVGWSGYFSYFFLDVFGIEFDLRFTSAPFLWLEYGEKIPFSDKETAPYAGFYLNKVSCPWNAAEACHPFINLPALVIIAICTLILLRGIKESVTFNNIMVGVKVTTILVFIVYGINYINPKNYTPFLPENTGVRGQFGLSGLLDASVSVFFAYIGFDAVTTAAQEAQNPQRDLPISIFVSLGFCTAFYIAVCLVLTGMVNYQDIDMNAPVAAAVRAHGSKAVSLITEFGALAGLTSVLLSSLLAQPRIFQTMSSDGLFPPVFAKLDPERKTPYMATLVSGILCALLGALLPVDVLGNLTSIGTLFAFFLVSCSVIILRRAEPNLPRTFQIPGGPILGGLIIPGTSGLISLFLIWQASTSAIFRLFIWLGLGLMVYFGYGYHYSRVGQGKDSLQGQEDYHELLNLQSSNYVGVDETNHA